LLRVVGMSWRQVELAKNAQNISALGHELYKSVGAFTGHMQKLGRSLGTAMNSYNDAVGSLERNVLSKARKLEELQAAPPGRSLESLDPVDFSVRSLNTPEL